MLHTLHTLLEGLPGPVTAAAVLAGALLALLAGLTFVIAVLWRVVRLLTSPLPPTDAEPRGPSLP